MQFSENLNHRLSPGVANFVIVNERVSWGVHGGKAGSGQASSLNKRIVKTFSFVKPAANCLDCGGKVEILLSCSLECSRMALRLDLKNIQFSVMLGPTKRQTTLPTPICLPLNITHRLCWEMGASKVRNVIFVLREPRWELYLLRIVWPYIQWTTQMGEAMAPTEGVWEVRWPQCPCRKGIQDSARWSSKMGLISWGA